MSTAICTAKPSTLNITEVYIAAVLLELSLQQHLVGDEQKIVKDVFLAGKVSSTGTAAAVKRPSEKKLCRLIIVREESSPSCSGL